MTDMVRSFFVRLSPVVFGCVLLFSLFFPKIILADIAFDSASNANSQTSSASLSWTHTSSGNELLLAVSSAVFDSGDAMRPIGSITYGSQSLTKVRSRLP